MGSGIIYYEIEKREKYEDSDERANSDLEVVKTRRYHFDDESLIHPLHSVCFDPDHPYELLVEIFWLLSVGDLRIRRIPIHKYRVHQEELVRRPNQPVREVGRPIKSWEFIPSSEGCMCEGDDVEDKGVEEGDEVEKNGDVIGVGGEGNKSEEEEDLEADVPEKEMHVIPRPMDVDVDKDFLQYLEEL
ncbi:hypothetical protein PIB30_018923 [Stylosanthes scabra]|uniref:Uncharacterized protein n=1 Tax=Stylosanthes scabra TaxID=79078 RepID=A0ABU6X788_9FABA|nr:hypothetical protein [Stylosanthes scabra]